MSSGGFDAGRIEASAHLDLTPFRRGLTELRRMGREAERQVNVPVGLDTKKADAQVIDFKTRIKRDIGKTPVELVLRDTEAKVRLSQFENRLDQMRSKVASARVDADTDQAKARLDQLDIQLRRVGTISSRPRVSIEGVQRANLQLDALALKLAAINRGGGGAGGGGFGGMLSRAGGHAPSFRTLGIGALLPLVPGAVGLGAGLGASLLTPTAAGLTGLGIFGAAAKSSVDQVQKDVEQLHKLSQRYNAATTNRQRATVLASEQRLYAGMDPAQRSAARNVQGLDTSWASFQRSLQPQSFAALAGGARLAETGLRYLLPTARAVGNEIVSLEHRAQHAFAAPFWRQFFGTFLPGEAARSVNVFGTALGHMLSGGAHLMQDFAPLGHDLENVVVRLTSKFDTWTQGQGPVRFVNWVEQHGPQAAQALEGIAHGLVGLGKGLGPIGAVELRALTPILNFIGTLGDEHPEVITALGGALLAVGGGLKVIQGINVARNIAGGVNSLDNLRRSALGVAGAVGAFSVGAAVGGHGAAGTAEGTLGGALSGMVAGLAVGGPWGAALGAAGGAVLGFAGQLFSARDAANQATRAMQGWMTTAYQADQFKIGQQFNTGVVSALQKSPQAASVFASAGVSISQIDSAIRSQDAIGSAAGRQLQNAVRAGKISQAQYQQGVKSLQALVDNFGSVVQNLDDIATITGKVSQHTADVTAGAQRLLRLIYAQPPKGASSKPYTPPTLTSLLTPPIPTRNTPRRAGGGPVAAGLAYLVGERGPELMVPHTAGTVLPTPTTTGLLGRQMAEAFGTQMPRVAHLLAQHTAAAFNSVISITQSRLDSARQQITADQQARTSYVTGLTSTLLPGLTGAFNSQGGVDSIGGFYASTAATNSRLLRDLGALRKRGLAQPIWQQIAEAGPTQGLNLAESILLGNSGSIASINRNYAAASGSARQLASLVGNAVYGPTIARDQEAIRLLRGILSALEHGHGHDIKVNDRSLAAAVRTGNAKNARR